MHLNTLAGIRKRWVCQGVEAALNRQPQARPSRTPKLEGGWEARVLAVSCSEPPPGHARWSLRLLADRLVELGIVPSFSHESVRRVLKKTKSSRICVSRG